MPPVDSRAIDLVTRRFLPAQGEKDVQLSQNLARKEGARMPCETLRQTSNKNVLFSLILCLIPHPTYPSSPAHENNSPPPDLSLVSCVLPRLQS